MYIYRCIYHAGPCPISLNPIPQAPNSKPQTANSQRLGSRNPQARTPAVPEPEFPKGCKTPQVKI